MLDAKKIEVIQNTVRTMVLKRGLHRRFKVLDVDDWINEVFIHFLRFPVAEGGMISKTLVHNAISKIVKKYSGKKKTPGAQVISLDVKTKMNKTAYHREEDMYVRVPDYRFTPEAIMYGDPDFIFSFVREADKPFLSSYIMGRENQMIFDADKNRYVSRVTKKKRTKEIIAGLRESLGAT